MGGRGQFSENKFDGVFKWHQIGELIGEKYRAKILGSKTEHKLPEESHSPNTIYARLNEKGDVYQIRIYENHLPIYDIDIGHSHKPYGTTHVHEYKNGSRIVIGKDGKREIYATSELTDYFKNILDDLGIKYD